VNSSDKILVVSNLYPDDVDPAKGVFVKNIVGSLRDEGVNVDLVVLSNFKGKLKGLVAYIDFYLSAILRILRGEYKVAYVHFVSHSALPVLIAKLVGKKIALVCHVHGADVQPETTTNDLYARVIRKISSLAVSNAYKIIVPSVYYTQVLKTVYGVDPQKIFVSPSGGVNLEVFNPASKREDSFELSIGYVGRLIQDKGILDFLSLLRELKYSGSKARGIIVGDGPLLSRIEEAMAELNITYIQRLGQSELVDVYNDMDLFIFPTTRKGESLGLVGLEAMACGVPVVAYKGNGPETYIENGKSGFLVDAGNVQLLTEKVKEYSGMSPAQRKRLSTRSQEIAKEYGSEKVRKELVAFFKDIYQ
jgi:glycosyltransferase involved in cell wall biosynthesis